MYKKLEMMTTEGMRAFELAANGATAIRYKNVFHEDLTVSIQEYGKYVRGEKAGADTDADVFSKLCYIMNASGEKKDMAKLSYDDFLTWLEQFEGDAISVAGNDIYAIYAKTQETMSEGKKK